MAVASGTFEVKPPSAWKITNRADGFGRATSAMWENAAPSQRVSSLDQRVTQWMSVVSSATGRLRNSAQRKLKGSSTSPQTRKSQPDKSA